MFVFTREGRLGGRRHGSNAAGSPPRGAGAVRGGGYEATFGRFEVDDGARTFTYTSEGSLVRTLVGKPLPRVYEFKGNQLIVKSATLRSAGAPYGSATEGQSLSSVRPWSAASRSSTCAGPWAVHEVVYVPNGTRHHRTARGRGSTRWSCGSGCSATACPLRCFRGHRPAGTGRWPGSEDARNPLRLRRRRAERGDGGGGGSRTRVRKRACERPYRFSPTWCFAPIVKAGQNRPRLVRLISPVAPGPRASSQPTLMTLCPTAVGG